METKTRQTLSFVARCGPLPASALVGYVGLDVLKDTGLVTFALGRGFAVTRAGRDALA